MRSVEASKKGVHELKKANAYQRNKRKKMCCLMWCLVIAACAILFPVLSSVLGNSR
eukprot:SAG22_NODE_3863_length_1493_cov_3.371593_1_plen_56_part_00